MIYKFIEVLQHALLPLNNEAVLARDDWNNASTEAIGQVVSMIPGVLNVVLFTLEYINSTQLSQPVRRLEKAVIRGVLKQPTEGPLHQTLLEREQTAKEKLCEAIQGVLNLVDADELGIFNTKVRDTRIHAGHIAVYRAVRKALLDDVFSEENKASLRLMLENKQPIDDVILKQVMTQAQTYIDRALFEALETFKQSLLERPLVESAALKESMKYLRQTRDACSSDPAVRVLLEMEAAEREKEYIGIRRALSSVHKMEKECPNWKTIIRMEHVIPQEAESLELGQIKVVLGILTQIEEEARVSSKERGRFQALREGLATGVFSDEMKARLTQALVKKRYMDAQAIKRVEPHDRKLDKTIVNLMHAFRAELITGTISHAHKVKLEAILTTRPLDKDGQVETITGIVDWVCGFAEQDFLSDLIRQHLGKPKAEGVPFPIHTHDAAQVIQAKKILGALHHGWRALESSEARELAPWIALWQQPWYAPKVWAVSWYAWLSEKVGVDAITQNFVAAWQAQGFRAIPQRFVATWHWTQGFRMKIMQHMLTTPPMQGIEDVPGFIWDMKDKILSDYLNHLAIFLGEQVFPTAFRVQEILSERHAAFNAIIQVEGALFEPFEDELTQAMAYASKYAPQIEDKKAFALYGVHRGGLGLAFLLDQLRTKKTGGADFPLLVEALLGLCHYMSQVTTELQDYLSETKPSGSASVLAGLGEAMAGGIQQEVCDRSRDERQRLKKLNRTASNILKVFTQGQGSKGSAWSYVANIACLGWYGWDLYSEVEHSRLALTSAGHESMRLKLLEYSARVGAFIGFLHKVEASFALKGDVLVGPARGLLESTYQFVTGYTSYVVTTQNLDLLQGATFNKARQAVLKEQCKKHRTKLEYINDVLLPALDYITGYQVYPGPASHLPRFFQALQVYVEAVDPALSNRMVARLKQGDALSHEDFRPYYVDIKARLIHARRTEQFSLASIHGVMNHHILGESTARKIARGASLLVKRDTRYAARHAAATQEAVFVWRRLARDVKARYERIMGASFRHGAGFPRRAPLSFSLPACYPETLVPASERKLGRYLLLNNGPNSNVEAMHTWVKRARVSVQDVIDSKGNKDSSLSLTNVVGMLDSVDRLFEAARNMQEDSVFSAATTVYLFDSLIRIVIQAYPYIQAMQVACTDVYHDMSVSLAEKQAYYAPHYKEDDKTNIKKEPDWVFQVMNVLLIGPLHMKLWANEAVSLPQADVREAHQKAQKFSLEVQRLLSLNEEAKRYYDDYALRFALSKPDVIFYMLSAGNGIAFGLRRVFGCSDTLDQEFVRAFQAFSKALYQTTIGHGLQKYNKKVAYPMRKRTAYLEQALCMKPGTALELMEEVLSTFRSGFAEYLSVTSKVFDEAMLDEVHHAELTTAMVESGATSHVNYLKARLALEAAQGVRKTYVRELGVDRSIRLDCIRTAQHLKLHYTNALYVDALKVYLRPAIQGTIRQEAHEHRDDGCDDFDRRVFELIHTSPSSDLTLLNDVEGKPSLRLKQIQMWLDVLDAEVTSANTSCYESVDTWLSKRTWVDMLQDISRNADNTPSERITAIHTLLKQKNLETTFEAYAPLGRMLIASKRALLWFLSWFGLYQQPSLDAYHALMWTAKPQTMDVEIFDAEHAKDYRQLEAILKKLFALEVCLTSKDAVCERKCIWLQHIRNIIENKLLTPRERIEEVRVLMGQENFKHDMLAYAPAERWTFEAFRQQVMKLLEYLGLSGRPCTLEYRKMEHAAGVNTTYSKAPLFTLFSKQVSSDTRPYTTSDVLKVFKMESNL